MRAFGLILGTLVVTASVSIRASADPCDNDACCVNPATCVVTDRQTLAGLTVDSVIGCEFDLGTYVTGGNGTAGLAPNSYPANLCGLSFSINAFAPATALNGLDHKWLQSTTTPKVMDLGAPVNTVFVFVAVDHGPFPEEGIESTVWGSNAPGIGGFPAGWTPATLTTIWKQGWEEPAVCEPGDNADDFTGQYSFPGAGFRYVAVHANHSISIFDDPSHTTWTASADNSSVPGWQSFDDEIDAVGTPLCDPNAVVADAGPDRIGLVGDQVCFDGSGSSALDGIASIGWDLDGDNEIDVTGPVACIDCEGIEDGEVALFVTDECGCVDFDTAGFACNLAVFLIIDEDSIDNGIQSIETISFGPPDCGAADSSICVNDDIADPGVRDILFTRGNDITPFSGLVLPTGQVGDEGLFRFTNPNPQRSQDDAAPFTIEEFILAAGAAADENNLDKIDGVLPLTAADILGLEGKTVCAVVYDSDVSADVKDNYASLKGATSGLTAFTVTAVGPDPDGPEGSGLPVIVVDLLPSADVQAVCESVPTPDLCTDVVCLAPDACTMSVCDPVDGMCVDSPIECPEEEVCDPETGECRGGGGGGSGECVEENGVIEPGEECDDGFDENYLNGWVFGFTCGVSRSAGCCGVSCQVTQVLPGGCGDVNGDGVVSVLDADLIGNATLTPPCAEMDFPERCDVDGSGTCDIFDSLRIVQATCGLAEIFCE